MEIRKPINNYEWIYDISNLWNTRSYKNKRRWLSKTPRILKNSHDSGWYWMIRLNGKPYGIHRLVAQMFIPNPYNKKEINHKDWDKLNNNINNLEWVNRSENMIHASKIWSLKTKWINQYTRDGIFVWRYFWSCEAHRQTNINPWCIYNCWMGKIKTAWWYKWRFD